MDYARKIICSSFKMLEIYKTFLTQTSTSGQDKEPQLSDVLTFTVK